MEAVVTQEYGWDQNLDFGLEHLSQRELQQVLGKAGEQPRAGSTWGLAAGPAAQAVPLETSVCLNHLYHPRCWKPHGKELLTKSGQHRDFLLH